MPEIDSLRVRIEADLSGLRRGLREAEQLVAQSSGNMTRSLAAIERPFQNIGNRDSSFQLSIGDENRQITTADRQSGALEGVTAASAMLGVASLAGPVSIGPAVATLIAGAILGALKPEVEALLSSALSGSPAGDSLSRGEALAASIANLDTALADIADRQEKDAIGSEEFERLDTQLRESRSDLLRQLDLLRKVQDAQAPVQVRPLTDCLERLCDRLEPLSQVGENDGSAVEPERSEVITGAADVTALMGGAGEDRLRLTEQVEAQASLSEAVERTSRTLSEQTNQVRSLNGATRDLGFTFASSFEDAVVEGRKLSEVVDGLEQDILRILTRRLVTEPLAGAVTGLLGGGLGLFAGTFHQGGRVGSAPVSGRVVPASLFADAPRFAAGGLVARAPRLAPGEVPAILHRGEVVRTPAQEAALARSAGRAQDTQVVVNIQTPDPRAFNESRGQIQAMLADAVRAGKRFR